MNEQKDRTQAQKGPIERMFEWTLGIVTIIAMIGLSWKYVIYPLFFGWY